MYEARAVELWLDLQGLNGEDGCGEVQLRFEYLPPSPALVTELESMGEVRKTPTNKSARIAWILNCVFWFLY